MNLFTKPKEKTTVEKILKEKEYTPPKVTIMFPALLKMKGYVDNSDNEIAWLGTVERMKDEYLITDVDLMKQEVSGHTAEIHESGLQEYAERLIQASRVDDLNKIKVWGHSHVNMDVSPSSQDESTFKEYYKNCDFFIRIIANKKGNMKIDIVELESELRFDNIPWFIAYPPEIIKVIEERVKVEEELNKVNKTVNKVYETIYKSIENSVKKEIKKYVKEERSYSNVKSFSNYSNNRNTDYDDYLKNFSNSIYTVTIHPGTDKMEHIEVDEIFADAEVIQIAEGGYIAMDLMEMLEQYEQFEGYRYTDWCDLHDVINDYYCEVICK